MNDPEHPQFIPGPAQVGLAAGGISPKPCAVESEEDAPIPNAVAAVEAILRQPRRVAFEIRRPGAGRLTAAMLLAAAVSGLVYGVIVGAFSGGSQLWAAPVKVVSGLLFSGLICLPSLYIFACLSGSRARLAEVAGWMAGLVMLMTILLVGFAPVAWIFSQSTGSVTAMGALHLGFALVATGFGLRFLNGGFVATDRGSGLGIKIWMAIFVLVLLQMTTALRPLIGKADTFLPVEKKFFVTHWLDCAREGGLPAKAAPAKREGEERRGSLMNDRFF